MVERQAILHGNVESTRLTGDNAEGQRRMLGDLRERVGSAAAGKFAKFLRKERLLIEGVVYPVDIDPDEDGNG